MEPSERDTVPIRMVLLAVGLGDLPLARLRTVGGRYGARIASCSTTDARASALALMPHAIIAPASLVAPGELDAIATESCSRLAVLPSDDASEEQMQAAVEDIAPPSLRGRGR